jgi:hypothetical protein
VAPLLGVGAARLLGAEMTGLTQPRLTPRIADTAKAGLDQVGATESFEIVNPFGRVVLTVCMLLGRLEVFTVLLRCSRRRSGGARTAGL